MSENSQAKKIVPVVLCGGSGTRLWPRSRPARPKPFLPLLGEKSLFRETLERFSDHEEFAPPIIVAGEAHRELIEEQSTDVEGLRMLIEPVAKNTAPAIALAAHCLAPDEVMLVCPSDHHIADPAGLREAARTAAELASKGSLVSLGLVPNRPETGYGYLKRGPALDGGFITERFVEKPDHAKACAFLEDGGYLWNAGIFAFGAAAFLKELEVHRPDIAQGVADAMAGVSTDAGLIRPVKAPLDAIAGESVDYAVMEHTAHAALVEADIGWSDIGSWQSLRDALPSDERGNFSRGPADFMESANVMVDSDGPRVSVVGLDDVIVVVDGDEILVTSAQGAQLVGKLPGASGK